MVFYLKKGFNFGLLRVNFSKSGIGLSFGIKGLRVGSGPTGNYVHAGRKGVYYKNKLPDVAETDGWLKLSWPMILFLGIVVSLAYFYLQANGDLMIMKELFLKQLTRN